MKTAKNAVDASLQLVATAQRRTFLNSRGIDPGEQNLQLDLIFEGMIHGNERFLPNDYARSALFTVRNKRETRRMMQNELIFHLHDDITITYTGIELRAQDDELVWLQILHYGARRAPLGEPFSFTIKELVNDLGWSKNGQYYDAARESISRLKANEIFISNDKAYGRGLAQSLIKEYTVENDSRGKPTKYTVWIDRNLIYLLAGNTFTNHNWERYRSYSPMARRLADYVASHRHPYPLTLENFAKMCDSKCKTKFKLTQMAEKACAEIEGKEAKQIRVFKDKIHIVR